MWKRIRLVLCYRVFFSYFSSTVVSGDAAAYAYLPASVEAFPRAEGLAAIMAAAGLVRVRYRRFGFGAVAIHVGEAPAGSAAVEAR